MSKKEQKIQQIKNYINTKLNPVMEKMVEEVLRVKPENLHEFMISYLQNDLQNHHKKQDQVKVPNAYDELSVDEDEDFDENLVPAKPNFNAVQTGRQRQSVSAEAFGLFNQKKEFQAKVIQKSEDVQDRIFKRLSQSFMFKYLDEKDKQTVLDAMEEKNFQAQDVVIQQGDDGDVLYVVDHGELDCFKKFEDMEQPQHLKVYHPGDSFGELALLYNAPRAATIISKTNSVLFSLDRDTFNNIVKTSAQNRKEQNEKFLSQVEILQTLNHNERNQIVDTLISHDFKEGEYVFREGDNSDNFYLVIQGKAQAQILIDGEQQTVKDYQKGDYFGELALLNNKPRAASIIAITDLKSVSIDKQAFKRLLGPLESILQRNADQYKKYVHK